MLLRITNKQLQKRVIVSLKVALSTELTFLQFSHVICQTFNLEIVLRSHSAVINGNGNIPVSFHERRSSQQVPLYLSFPEYKPSLLI